MIQHTTGYVKNTEGYLILATKNIFLLLGISTLFGVLIVKYNLLVVPILAVLIFFILALYKYEFIFYFGISSFLFLNLAIIHFGTFDGKPYQIIWSIAFISYVVKSVYNRKEIFKYDKIDIPLLTLLLVYIFSMPNSINSLTTFRECLQLLYFILIFKIIYSSVKNKEEIIKITHLMIILGLIFIGVGLLTLTIGHAPIPQLLVDVSNKKISLNTDAVLIQKAMKSLGKTSFKRVGSCFLDYVATANVVCQILMILLAIIGGKHLIKKKKITLSIELVLGVILLIFTFSRAGMIIFTLCTVLLMAYRRQFKSILIFSLILISVIMLYKPLTARMKEARELNQGSTRGHLALYLGAWDIFMHSPWHGTGAGTFKELNKFSMIKDIKKKFNTTGWPDAHNMFLQCAAETGIMGLVSLISIVIICFHSMLKAIWIQKDDYYRDILIGLTLATFAAILMNMTMNAFGVETFWVMLGVSYTAAALVNYSSS